MSIDVGNALIGIVGVLVGAIIQYSLTKRAEQTKHLRELRTSAYVDFIRAVAGIATSGKHNDAARQLEYTILLADAKARIAIYGDTRVVAAAAQFFRGTSALHTPEEMDAFLKIVAAMRSSAAGKLALPEADLSQLLFSRQK